MEYLYIAATLILTASYIFLLIFILYKWNQPQVESKISDSTSDVSYTILIPVRNEEKHITKCLNSILSNKNFDFSRVEILVIDDYSEDNTAQTVKQLNHQTVKLISLKDHHKNNPSPEKINAFKKAALNLGLRNSTGDYIIQLDGDVIVPERYLETIDLFVKEKQPDFVAAPVVFNSTNSTFQNFQVLDFLGMMLVTQAGIESKFWYMANGANMIYKKKLLSFSTTSQASGDDIFGIQTIAEKKKNNIHFLKSSDVTVSTDPQSTCSKFISQRLRWATKNKQMNGKMLVMMTIPFLNALMMPIHILCIYFFGSIAIIMLSTHLMFKMMIDYIYLKEASEFFQKPQSMKSFLPSFFMHLFYLGMIGLLSLFVNKYTWKGRKVY